MGPHSQFILESFNIIQEMKNDTPYVLGFVDIVTEISSLYLPQAISGWMFTVRSKSSKGSRLDPVQTASHRVLTVNMYGVHFRSERSDCVICEEQIMER